MKSDVITVMCVDDHRIVRDGIALFVNRQIDMKVVASAASAEEAIRLFRVHRPEVTLMDLQLGQISGVDAIRALRAEAPNAAIIVLTMFQGDEDIFKALHAGAATYLLKDTLPDDLITVIREVVHGTHRLHPEIEALLAQRASGPTVTPREVQVIELIAQGMRNKEIGASLGISEETVQVHVKNILAKLQVHDRSAAITVALRRGIIHLS